MKADLRDIEALTRIVARLEVQLKSAPSAAEEANIRQLLKDAQKLRAFIAEQAGIKITH